MTLELEKTDLVHMVLGVSPPLAMREVLTKNGYGLLCRSTMKYSWNKYKINNCSEAELRALYILTK